MTQQRNEYIAEKILDGDRICYDNNRLLGWYIPKVYRFFPIDTNFESLPEWTGPICDVVLPILAERNWTIVPKINGNATVMKFEFDQSEGDWEWFTILSERPFPTVLVDAHMKISEEKGEQ
ncbi:hypothetical protein [Leptospira santarosai]|uniref:hypothetical protein n=1 Tax=Leptospira santarosai TaxID=28183 RepID=UPI000518B5A5|nr:hypothetical protein [Leptospira santarosai]